ncbi:MAG: NADH-quinone oxidoreductase subunit N, partial [bacterium]
MMFDATTVIENVSCIIPEMVLLVATLLVIVFDLFLSRKESYQSGILAFVGLACALCGLLVLRTEGPPAEAFSGLLLLDNLSYFFRVFFLVSTIAVVVMSLMSKGLVENYRCGEYFVLLMSATLGMMLLAAATDFLMLVLALETLSLASFVLVGYYKKDRSSSEAALKYVLFGSVASAIMLYGISFLYGLTGTLSIADVFSVAMAKQAVNFNTVLVALILIMVGVGFKIAAVPFHFWAPDVYQGAPTPVTAWLSVASKAAGFAILFRLFGPLLPLGSLDDPHWGLKSLEQMAAHLRLDHFFWFLSVVTMFFGNLIALRQTNVKRLLAYSSIAHVGYL